MLDQINRNLTDRVAALVHGFLAKRGVDGRIGHDDDLTTSGFSSLDVVNLMLSVEAEFGITVPERDMTPSNFRSIGQIVMLLQTIMGEP